MAARRGTRSGPPAVLLECDGYTVVIVADPFELSLETPEAGGEGGQLGGNAAAATAAGSKSEPPRLALNTNSLLHYEAYEAKDSGWGGCALPCPSVGICGGDLVSPVLAAK